MYHKGYVVLGIILFLALLATPYWVSAGAIKYEDVREELSPSKGTACIYSKEWMAQYHMELLNEWRELAVRDGVRTYTTPNGVFNVSLTECWQCHDYEGFCAKCHDFMEVRPVCWDCHYNPSMELPTVNYLK
ncbi:sulfate reduction electron transfer complex DsrMKJOP subunit DsrJ [Archaeoglobus profundus]|uniref:Cytochrome c family protein n=1 Tax=Archaeoglobus profundus (strain DSM 5631 / JCM 9629 / NBRC 100127 / Av18) TaxID=572546 RepID=D2RF82_ARCPA|nr:sulfate reduction electron transfer complex DsrMKJOP subunit DsrJ [Archaeoglobus profundus]ADB58776.1 cytochrome c family protein [Archaeoglobus profundus DSM 5631]